MSAAAKCVTRQSRPVPSHKREQSTSGAPRACTNAARRDLTFYVVAALLALAHFALPPREALRRAAS